ncbi:QueT transporter family protein [Peptoniphilus sp. GNH]|nr:hypothetical protein HMPREF3189_00973 [Clostridiales bacterium KA00134]UHR03469.1 QueT transporter family protein [Peptoniphilus sp. GNH]
MNIKDLVKNAILIAIYVVVIGVNPIGFGAIQFRIGEALSVIPFFNRKYVPALIIGGALANLYSPLGPIDMVVGAACAIIAYSFSKFIKSPYINSLIFATASGILVAGELSYTGDVPFFLTALSVGGSTLFITLLASYLVEKSNLKKIIKES